jgi:hypothetical protein
VALASGRFAMTDDGHGCQIPRQQTVPDIENGREGASMRVKTIPPA